MANTAYGLKLQVNDGTSAAYADIEGLISVTVSPHYVVGKYETHHLESANQIKTYSPGWLDPQSVEFVCRYDNTEHVRLYGLVGDAMTWKLISPDSNETWTFGGFLTECKVEDMGLEDTAMSIKGVIQMSGSVTLS
jgi:hypothetical protein